MRYVRNLFVILSVVCLLPQAGAQQNQPAGGAGAGGKNEKSSSLSGPRKHMATILFAGLGGAVLGLSTLSFYGRPQDKLSNIAMGFAFGVIIGTGYVTYKAISTPTEFYGKQAYAKPEIEDTLQKLTQGLAPQSVETAQLQLSLEF